MPTPSALAAQIRQQFSSTSAKTIEEAIEQAMLSEGASPFTAGSVALELADAVLDILRSDTKKNTTFALSSVDGRRLVGKARNRSDDPEIATRVRARIGHLMELKAAVAELSPCEFERLGAAIMKLYGATSSFAGCASGDGGIDIYGRIPLRTYPDGLPKDLLAPLFLSTQPVLFLGQCKSIGLDGAAGRPELSQFSKDVESCLAKYSGATKLPPKRVPASFYRQKEPAISLFFTTGSFSSDALGSDVAPEIVLVDGIAIAQSLLFHAVGFEDSDTGPRVSISALRTFMTSTLGESAPAVTAAH